MNNIESPNHAALRIVSLFSGRTYSDEKTAMSDLTAMIEREIASLRELHIMQLAAISTAAMQNTETTIKDRIGKDNPYWTPAYGDMCATVDREMKHRGDRDKLRAALKAMVLGPGITEESLFSLDAMRAQLRVLPMPDEREKAAAINAITVLMETLTT